METYPSPTPVPLPNDELRAELAATAADLRVLKRWWRTPPDHRPEAPPPTHTGLGLCAARLRATLLHLALAHTRRRLHLQVWKERRVGTLAEQAALLADELARLDKLLITRPALDPTWRARLAVILGR